MIASDLSWLVSSELSIKLRCFLEPNSDFSLLGLFVRLLIFDLIMTILSCCSMTKLPCCIKSSSDSLLLEWLSLLLNDLTLSACFFIFSVLSSSFMFMTFVEKSFYFLRESLICVKLAFFFSFNSSFFDFSCSFIFETLLFLSDIYAVLANNLAWVSVSFCSLKFVPVFDPISYIFNVFLFTLEILKMSVISCWLVIGLRGLLSALFFLIIFSSFYSSISLSSSLVFSMSPSTTFFFSYLTFSTTSLGKIYERLSLYFLGKSLNIFW